MKDILFKAKRIKNEKWIEGYYYKMSETTYCFKKSSSGASLYCFYKDDGLGITKSGVPGGNHSRNTL